MALALFSSSWDVYSQNEPLYVHPRQDEAIVPNPHSEGPQYVDCNAIDPSNPCPFDNAPTRYFKVNIHYVLTEQGDLNFTPSDDGDGGSLNGYVRAEQIIDEANRQTVANSEGWGLNPRPPVCNLNFKLLLNGVYFHYTDVGLNPARTAYNWGTLWGYLNQQYVNAANEINIFVFEATNASGTANGNHATLHNMWSDYHNGEVGMQSNWYITLAARVIWHEVFHNNGLPRHPFEDDGCSDTPTFNPPCWAWSPDPNNRCHTQGSNNLMDYNGYPDWSLSPCQICKINENYQSGYVTNVSNDCPPAVSFFDVDPQVCCNENTPTVIMYGSASVNETRHFIEIYEVNAIGSTAVKGGYYSNWFFTQAGNVDLRTFCGYPFECAKIYRIKLAVMSGCAPWHETVRYASCNLIAEGGNIKTLDVVPNPATNNISINLDLEQGSHLNVQVFNLIGGGAVKTVATDQAFDAGPSSIGVDVSDLGEGTYLLRVTDNSSVWNKQFIIQR